MFSRKSIIKLNITLTLGIMFAVFNQCVAPMEPPGELEFSSDGSRSLASVDSRAAFERTVYPLTRRYCATCHATQSPRHASGDSQEAHDAVVDLFKVNFSNIPRSRLIAKLRDEAHNCWSDCESDAQDMQVAIEEWYEVIKAVEADSGNTSNMDSGECKIEQVVEVIEEAADSVASFQSTLYQLTSTNCTTCHISRMPRHANSDINTAHDDLILGDWIDFQSPANSPLVIKIQGGHQGRQALAPQMITAIQSWAQQRGAVVQKEVVKTVMTGDCGSNDPGTTPQTPTVQQVIDGDSGMNVANTTVRLDINNANILDDDFELIGSGTNAFLRSKDGTPGSTGTPVNDGGYATLTFTIPQTGNYKMSAEILAPSGSENSFWLRVDNENYLQWHTDISTSFSSQVVTQNAGQEIKTWTNLSAGTHTLHIKHREHNTSIRNIVFYPEGQAVIANPDLGTMVVDLQPLTGIAGATLTANIELFDDFSYRMSNLRINSPTNIYIKNIQVLMNGYFNPQNSTYTVVDKVVGPNDSEVSPFSMLFLHDNGPGVDRIQFKFEVIEVRP
jgi:hypothetical protein